MIISAENLYTYRTHDEAAGYGDDLRCVGASRAEAQECVDMGSAVFHFFGLEASPKKMWVRRLRFDQEGLQAKIDCEFCDAKGIRRDNWFKYRKPCHLKSCNRGEWER